MSSSQTICMLLKSYSTVCRHLWDVPIGLASILWDEAPL